MNDTHYTQAEMLTEKKLLRKKNTNALLCCIVGVAINLIFSNLAKLSGFPVYLDTVGTILSAVLGGYLPGVIVGFTTNLLKGITDITSIYYGVLNVIIAVCTAFFAKKGLLKKVSGILLTLIILTLIGGGLGTLLPWCMDELTFDAESLGAKIYSTGHFSTDISQLIANLITDFMDKFLTLLFVYIINKVIPDNIKQTFRIAGWKQTPLSAEEEKAARSANSRLMSMQTKILLMLTVAMVAVAAAATSISIMIYRSNAIKEHIRMAQGAANMAATIIDPDKVADYLENGSDSPGYNETKNMLYRIRSSSPDIEYIYVYSIRKDGCHVVFDLDTDDVAGDPPGTIVPFDESFLELVPDLLAGKEIEPIITDDTYGWLLTVYQPVFDSAGNCVCYAAADVSMNQINDDERNFLVEELALFLGFFILILIVVWELVEYNMVLPVNSMALSADAFAYNSEEAREVSLEKLRYLNIHTGDEVENLYRAFVKTSEDSMNYVTAIQEKTETISRMQNALIMVLADIVESRDKNTGDHIRKTAAYTAIIMKHMRKLGIYTDQLTDKFVADVVSSAPLHDIGKITIPDAILNKPGRLTDEEFEKMKEHAIAGSEIIGKTISLVPDSGYLSEARNMAEFHHEKWNGKGYPHGLKGTDIPLSARIMAVADVFDALVSKRSYKEPFTFEKAQEIIREGAGSHFDPRIVEAFFDAEAEVREVAEKFNMADTPL